MTILYFTATGNCLYVARRIGGRLCSIPQAARKSEYQFEDEEVGIVLPVYGLCVPPYIKEFIKKAEFKCKYLFAIITYGFYAGAAASDLQDSIKPEGRQFDYINRLKMVEDYLPGFEMKKQQHKINSENLEKQLKSIVEDIKERKSWITHDSVLDKFMTDEHKKNYAYNIGEGMTKNYQVEESCRGCGTCVKVCPVNNIHLSAGKPEFGNSCISCLACTQNCPSSAIRLLDEKSRERFRNAEITLQDIIDANE